MTEAVVAVRYTGDSLSLIAAQDAAASSAEDSAVKMKVASEDANSGVSGAFKKMSGSVLGYVDNMFGTDFSKAADKASSKLEEVGTNSTGLFSKLSSIGAGASVGIGVAAVVIGGMAIDLGEKYQALTTNIAAWGGISNAAAKQITDAFLSTAGTTIYSASEIATSYGKVVGQLTAVEGHALTSKDAMTVMKASMDLAEGSGESLGTATTALAGVMQTYQMKVGDAGKASDQLFSIAKGSGTSLGAVAQSVKQVHTQLGAMTPPLGQTGALLVDMVEHGMNGSRALRSLGTSMNALLKPSENLLNAQSQSQVALKALPPSLQALGAQYLAGTTTAAQVTAATGKLDRTQTTLWGNLTKAAGAIDTSNLKISQMGFSAFNAQGKFIGLKQTFTDLYNQIKGETPKAQLATLAQDGLASSAAKLLPVIAAGPAAFDKAATAVEKTGAAHAAAAKQAQTLSHEFELMKVTVEDLITKLGVVLIPIVTTVMGVFSKATEFVLKHKDILYALAVLIGGFLTVTIGAFAINTMGKLISSIGNAGQSVGNFVGKITGMGTEIEEPTSELEAASTAMQEAMQTAAEIIQTASETIASAWENIGSMATDNAGTVDSEIITMQESMLGLGGAADTMAATVSAAYEEMSGAATEAAATMDAADTGIAAGGAEAAGGAGIAGAAGAGVAGEAGAAGAGEAGAAGIGASSVMPALIAAVVSFKGTGDLLHRNVLDSGTAVKNLGNMVAGWFGHSASQDLAKDTRTNATKYLTANDLPLLGGIISGAIKSTTVSKSQAEVDVKMLGGDALATAFKDAGDKAGTGVIDGLIAHNADLKNESKVMHDLATNPLKALQVDLGVAGDKAGVALVKGFNGHKGDSLSASQLTHDAITGKLQPLVTDLQKIGHDSSAGIVQEFINQVSSAGTAGTKLGTAFTTGISTGIGSDKTIVNTITTMMNNAVAAAKTTIKASSPSKRTSDEIGLPFVQGIAHGILNNIGLLASAASTAVGSMFGSGSRNISAAAAAVSGASSGGSSGGSSGPVTVILQIDGQRFAQAILSPLQSTALRNQKTGGQFTINLA